MSKLVKRPWGTYAVLAKSKDFLLKKIHNEQWILFFEHDPNYQACTIDLGSRNYFMKKPVVISE